MALSLCVAKRVEGMRPKFSEGILNLGKLSCCLQLLSQAPWIGVMGSQACPWWLSLNQQIHLFSHRVNAPGLDQEDYSMVYIISMRKPSDIWKSNIFAFCGQFHFIGCTNHLVIMLKCRFWFSRSGMVLKILHFYTLPGDTDIAGPKTALVMVRSWGTQKWKHNTTNTKRT